MGIVGQASLPVHRAAHSTRFCEAAVLLLALVRIGHWREHGQIGISN